jgi:Ca-activated chloride channel homolog
MISNFKFQISNFRLFALTNVRASAILDFRFQISNFRFILAIFVLLIGFVSSFSQDEDVIKVNTKLITFEVTVTDKNGTPIRGLTEKDFRLFENNTEKKIEFFEPIKKTSQGRPLSIVFALDISGSMTTDEIAKLRLALNSFVNRLADYQSYFAVMTFGMDVKTLQSFTNKREKLEKSFDKILKDERGLSTHTYDATDDAIRLLQKKAPKTSNNKLMKRAVVLITDGFPVGDTVSVKTVIERANQAETSVYAVILPSFSKIQKTKPLPTPLEISGLIEKTGGKSFYANEKNFEPLFKALAEEITASYILAFYPDENKKSDNAFNIVRIETNKNFTIKQNRNGYKLKDE